MTIKVTHTYDPFGNLLGTSAGGVATALEYDLRGRKTKMTDPDMGVWTCTTAAPVRRSLSLDPGLPDVVVGPHAKLRPRSRAFDPHWRFASGVDVFLGECRCSLKAGATPHETLGNK